MKEFSHAWFLQQAKESNDAMKTWPDSMRKNMVLASATLPTMTPTKPHPKKGEGAASGNTTEKSGQV